MQDRLHLPYFVLDVEQISKSTYIFQGVNRSSGDAHHIDPSCGIFMDLYVGFPHLIQTFISFWKRVW